MLAGLRAHDTHVTRGAAVVPTPTRIALLTGACRATLRTEGLRAAAVTKRVVDERVATEARRAARALREGITLIDLNGGADVRTARIDVHVEAGVGRLRAVACAGRAGIARLTARAPTVPAPRGTSAGSTAAACARRDLDGASAMKQRENGAQ